MYLAFAFPICVSLDLIKTFFKNECFFSKLLCTKVKYPNSQVSMILIQKGIVGGKECIMPRFISQGRQRYPFALEYKKLLAFLKLYSFLNLFWPTYHMVKASFLTLGQTFELVVQYQISTINDVFQFRSKLKVILQWDNIDFKWNYIS